MPDPSKRCPKCRGEVRRVHRRVRDRILNLVKPVRRYRCRNSHCRWEGDIFDGQKTKAKKSVNRVALGIAVAVSVLVLGTCSIKFIERIGSSESAGAE